MKLLYIFGEIKWKNAGYMFNLVILGEMKEKIFKF